MVLWLGTDRSDTKNVWVARLSLLLFAASCAGIVAICRSLQVHVCFGFLVGLPFAWPLMLKPHDPDKPRRAVMLLWTLTAFTVYYWVSALFVLWKTG